MNVVNLTPHAISIISLDGETITYEPSGVVARVVTKTLELRPISGFRVRELSSTFGVEGLPDPEPDTIYLVSSMVLAKTNRANQDVFAPDTGGDAIRDKEGRICAVRGLLGRNY